MVLFVVSVYFCESWLLLTERRRPACLETIFVPGTFGRLCGTMCAVLPYFNFVYTFHDTIVPRSEFFALLAAMAEPMTKPSFGPRNLLEDENTEALWIRAPSFQFIIQRHGNVPF